MWICSCSSSPLHGGVMDIQRSKYRALRDSICKLSLEPVRYKRNTLLSLPVYLKVFVYWFNNEFALYKFFTVCAVQSSYFELIGASHLISIPTGAYGCFLAEKNMANGCTKWNNKDTWCGNLNCT